MSRTRVTACIVPTWLFLDTDDGQDKTGDSILYVIKYAWTINWTARY